MSTRTKDVAVVIERDVDDPSRWWLVEVVALHPVHRQLVKVATLDKGTLFLDHARSDAESVREALTEERDLLDALFPWERPECLQTAGTVVALVALVVERNFGFALGYGEYDAHFDVSRARDADDDPWEAAWRACAFIARHLSAADDEAPGEPDALSPLQFTAPRRR